MSRDIVSIYHHTSGHKEPRSLRQQEKKRSKFHWHLQHVSPSSGSVNTREQRSGQSPTMRKGFVLRRTLTDFFFFFMLVKRKEEEKVLLKINQPRLKGVCLQCVRCHFTGLKGCLEGHLAADRSVSAPLVRSLITRPQMRCLQGPYDTKHHFMVLTCF